MRGGGPQNPHNSDETEEGLGPWPGGPGGERHGLVSSLLCCPSRGLGFRCPPLKMEKEQLPRSGGQ